MNTYDVVQMVIGLVSLTIQLVRWWIDSNQKR